jgi:hypothetical protein
LWQWCTTKSGVPSMSRKMNRRKTNRRKTIYILAQKSHDTTSNVLAENFLTRVLTLIDHTQCSSGPG